MYQNNGNILLVSADKQELNRFRSSFISSYNVYTANSVRQAYEVLSDYEMHVVLIEQKMPSMSGLQFCESISHDFPGLTTIILNNSESTASLERAYRTDQIFSFIQKPYSLLDLKMAVDNAFKLHKAKLEKKQLSDQISEYENKQNEILQLFKRYVPGEVVSQALKTNKDDIMKPGESRIVSVLFADIRHFTRLTAQLPPSEVVKFLNDYWNIISACVRENKGSVNKYMGDGLLAVFGAPVSYINNHENAVNAALDMINALEKINQKYSQILGTEIQVGIGINSGEVIVGNIGTENFMEYTVIGNTVNIASRLETISKEKPNSIVISKETFNLIEHAFQTTELIESNLSDKNEAIYYCRVIGPKPDNIHPMNTRSNIQ